MADHEAPADAAERLLTRLCQQRARGGLTSPRSHRLIEGNAPSAPQRAELSRRNAARLTELVVPLPNLDVLIGLDVIRQCLWVIDGPGGTFSVTF